MDAGKLATVEDVNVWADATAARKNSAKTFKTKVFILPFPSAWDDPIIRIAGEPAPAGQGPLRLAVPIFPGALEKTA